MQPFGLRVPGAIVARFGKMGVDSVEYHRRTVVQRGDDHPSQALGYYGCRGETPLAAWRTGWGLPVPSTTPDTRRSSARAVPVTRIWERAWSPRHGGGVEPVVAAHKTVAVLALIGRVEDMHTILDAETDATLRFLEE